jgi:hypothetical protein
MIDLVVHQYYENVVETLKHSKKELGQLMTNAIDDKRNHMTQILGKWCFWQIQH